MHLLMSARKFPINVDIMGFYKVRISQAQTLGGT